MSSLSSKFSAAETGVFWDLDGCPIPAGLSPVSIRANIKLALENMGYTGNVSIVAFSVEKQSEEVESEFKSAQIELKHQGTRQEKDRLMYLDVMFWGVRHRSEPSNVLVVSDDLSPKPRVNYVPALVLLKEQENNILLVQPGNNPEGQALRDTVTSTWLWESLATGGSPLDGHSIEPAPAPACSVCSTRETMSSLSSKFSAAETGVFWDLDGCPIPAGLSPVSIRANIKLALENMGYTGNVSIFAYSVEQSEGVEFESAQIKLKQQGTRQEKDQLMYLDIMFWGVDHRCEASNVLVISKDLRRGDDFASGLVFLKENENNILLALLYNPGGLPLRDTVASTWLWKSLATGGSPLDGHCIKPEPTTPCSVCSTRPLRLANKRSESPTKPFLKPRRKSQKSSRASPHPSPDPED